MICTDCHRHLKNPPVMIGGRPFGPKCAARARILATTERDLFGFSTARPREQDGAWVVALVESIAQRHVVRA